MVDAVNSNTVAAEKLDKYLKANGMRRTPERYKILEQVLAFPKQFAVEDLEQAMASNAFAVSKATIMCEHCKKVKLVKDLNFMAYMNARKFAAFTTSYYNLTIYGVCNDCARRIKREKQQLAIANRKKKQQ